jgi:hypothetical protein
VDKLITIPQDALFYWLMAAVDKSGGPMVTITIAFVLLIAAIVIGSVVESIRNWVKWL